jgi:hypothetical protein
VNWFGRCRCSTLVRNLVSRISGMVRTHAWEHTVTRGILTGFLNCIGSSNRILSTLGSAERYEWDASNRREREPPSSRGQSRRRQVGGRKSMERSLGTAHRRAWRKERYFNVRKERKGSGSGQKRPQKQGQLGASEQGGTGVDREKTSVMRRYAHEEG